MLIKLFLLFFFVPLFELALLLKIGQYIGALNTVLLVIVTAAIGAGLTRYQGLKIWKRLISDLRSGQLPGDTLLEGVIIFAGGLVLLTPGLITDAFGFFCLIPTSRRWLREKIKNWLRNKLQSGRIQKF